MIHRTHLSVASFAGILTLLIAVDRATADPVIPVAYGGWNLQPSDAALMVVSAHPDDEGLFLGGLIPYYSTVLNVPMVHVAATSGERLPPGRTTKLVYGSTREAELLNADWAYGLRNQPIFTRLRAGMSVGSDANTAFEGWAIPYPEPLPAEVDPELVAIGRLNAATALATLIRTYKPEVIVTQEAEGDWSGHADHKAMVVATIDAFAMAANSSVHLDGLPEWQTSKLYLHRSNRDSTLPVLNKLWHDWSTPCAELDGMTPLQVADAGLAYHGPTEGDVVAQYSGKRFSEQYSLYASTVGADTVDGDGWARRGFFEHISFVPGDTNGDQLVNATDANRLAAHWGATVSCGATDGDFNRDGVVNAQDASILAANWGNYAREESAPGVPEPAAFVLLLGAAVASIVARLRQPRGRQGPVRREIGPAG